MSQPLWVRAQLSKPPSGGARQCGNGETFTEGSCLSRWVSIFLILKSSVAPARSDKPTYYTTLFNPHAPSSWLRKSGRGTTPHKDLHRLGHNELPTFAIGQLSRSGFQPSEERMHTYISTLYGDCLTIRRCRPLSVSRPTLLSSNARLVMAS